MAAEEALTTEADSNDAIHQHVTILSASIPLVALRVS
jgi:hypothetical protein